MSKTAVLAVLSVTAVFTLVGYQVWNLAMDVKEDGWKAIFFPVEVLGPIGMNDGARLAFCAAADSIVQATSGDGVHVRCTGKHVNTAVLSLDEVRPITYGRVRVDLIADGMRQQYQVLLADFKTVSLYADRATGRTDPPAPISEIAAKADKLGVKTSGRFLGGLRFSQIRCQRRTGQTGAAGAEVLEL
jgi:hypothetical protein